MTKILKFNSDIYKILLDLLPEKEYESVLHTSEQPSTTQQPVSDISGIADTRLKLKELKSMLEEDLITEEEYNNKKQELLSKM